MDERTMDCIERLAKRVEILEDELAELKAELNSDALAKRVVDILTAAFERTARTARDARDARDARAA
jgi:uncharacterized protein YegL